MGLQLLAVHLGVKEVVGAEYSEHNQELVDSFALEEVMGAQEGQYIVAGGHDT